MVDIVAHSGYMVHHIFNIIALCSSVIHGWERMPISENSYQINSCRKLRQVTPVWLKYPLGLKCMVTV